MKEPKQEHIVVYETLRSSIISCEERIVNEKIYMYMAYFALMTFGIDRSWTILFSYLLLIAFQTMINGEKMSVKKCSTYIRVFFENADNSLIHWETLHTKENEKFIQSYIRKTRGAAWHHIEKFSSSFLAIVSLFILLITSLQKYNFNGLPMDIIIEIIFAVLLCVFVIYINSKLYTDDKDSKDTWESDIKEYYNEWYGQEYSSEVKNNVDIKVN